jgi:diguanylate cyclase (GGDEF)-like protein
MRERLIALGYKSLVAIPLSMQARQGALLLASRATNQVSRREMLLLQDIRSSLAFALQSGEDAGAAKYLAYFDPLTGLAKRTLLCERVDGVLRTLSGPESALTIAAFDIHGLTDINDRFGYRIGDLLLQQVAERLKRNIETQERIGHLGGGTFVLLEPGLSASAENVAALLEGTVFGEPFDIDGNIIRGSFSLGITRYPNDGGCADVLIQNAEAALKRAKEGTGERYLTYEVRMHGEAARRMELEHKLRAALDQQEFVIHYQPIVDVVSGRIQSLEALLRWSQPEGIVSPAHFLPLLESSGLIVPVGTWVLERAVRDCLRLQSLGLGPVRIAVNISALQLRRRSFVDEVLKVAAGLSGEGYGLDLEITESGLLQDIGATTRKLQRLRAAGIGVALDDFGTGYSSLGLLSKLPVDVLKIDRSFVKGLPRDSASVALTSSIVGLATAFGLGTVAEGVETAEQLAKIRELGCRRWQGYLYSRPVVLDEIEVMLASGVPLASTGVAARPN